ncbi:MAG: hypothetical protein KGH64_01325 [Candidatus Micrarchaeota archaeon]|nr:hypothetical protein [Candidatus Micrarchaeota archaeon]MDE1833958.1 hypothetical protein [Candidatus Micrarchaeota archaeon]MDE1859774.1 hypothetical protein [Candidatus Micrarchaeota archaeon]
MGFTQPRNKAELARLDALVREIYSNSGERREELVKGFFVILERERDTAMVLLQQASGYLKIRDASGKTAADQIAKHGHPDAIRELLRIANEDDGLHRDIIAQRHMIGPGIEVDAFTLAIATLSTSGVDATNHDALAKKVRSAQAKQSQRH